MALKETTKNSVHQKLNTERGKKDDASIPSSRIKPVNPKYPQAFNFYFFFFLHFSHIKVMHNRKLNFCSVWVSQEAFLPHVNGMAARHFWKEKMIMQVKRLSGIKGVQIINGTGCKQKSNRKGCKLQWEGICQHTVSISEQHTAHMAKQKDMMWSSQILSTIGTWTPNLLYSTLLKADSHGNYTWDHSQKNQHQWPLIF